MLAEDLFIRCFLVSADKIILRILNVKDDKSKEFAEIQRAIWMGHENITSVFELASILSASIFCIVLQSQSLAFDLGYNAEGNGLSTPTLFAYLLLQLCGEIFVTYIAAWVKTERGIPVMKYFYTRFSYRALLHWQLNGLVSCLLTLYSFIRHVNVFFCTSSHACDCLHLPQIDEWYHVSCAIESSLRNITTVQEMASLTASIVPFLAHRFSQAWVCFLLFFHPL